MSVKLHSSSSPSSSSISPAAAPPCCIVSTSKSFTIESLLSQNRLSQSERLYIEDGIRQSFRNDGRSLIDYRPFTVETDILPLSNGSAKVKTADSELVVGVKCQIANISESNDRKNFIQCSVDCSASLNIEIDPSSRIAASEYLSRLIEQMCLNSAVVDPVKLEVVAGELGWIVYVDVVILYGVGNLIDAISLGIKAALSKTLLPAVRYKHEWDPELGEKKLVFDVDPRPEVGEQFPADDVPICITIGQIQSRFIWDLSPEEEACVSARLTVAVDSSGRCRGIHKAGGTPIRTATILSALQNSRVIGAQLHRNLHSQLKS